MVAIERDGTAGNYNLAPRCRASYNFQEVGPTELVFSMGEVAKRGRGFTVVPSVYPGV